MREVDDLRRHGERATGQAELRADDVHPRHVHAADHRVARVAGRVVDAVHRGVRRA